MLESSSDIDKISNTELQAQINKMRKEIRKYNDEDLEDSNPSDYQDDEEMGRQEKYPIMVSPQGLSNKDSININLKKKYALINAPISPIRSKSPVKRTKAAMGPKNSKFFEQGKIISKTQGIYIVASGKKAQATSKSSNDLQNLDSLELQKKIQEMKREISAYSKEELKTVPPPKGQINPSQKQVINTKKGMVQKRLPRTYTYTPGPGGGGGAVQRTTESSVEKRKSPTVSQKINKNPFKSQKPENKILVNGDEAKNKQSENESSSSNSPKATKMPKSPQFSRQQWKKPMQQQAVYQNQIQGIQNQMGIQNQFQPIQMPAQFNNNDMAIWNQFIMNQQIQQQQIQQILAFQQQEKQAQYSQILGNVTVDMGQPNIFSAALKSPKIQQEPSPIRPNNEMIQRLEQNAEAYQSKNAKLMSQLKDLESELASKNNSIDDLLKKQGSDSENLSNFKKQMDQKTQENFLLKQDIDKHKSEIEKFKKMFVAKEDLFYNKTRELEQINEEYKKLQVQMQQRIKQEQQYVNQIIALKDRIKVLEKNNSNDDFRKSVHNRHQSAGYNSQKNFYNRESNLSSHNSQMRGTGMAESLNYDQQDNIGPNRGYDPYMVSKSRVAHSRDNSEELDMFRQQKAQGTPSRDPSRTYQLPQSFFQDDQVKTEWMSNSRRAHANSQNRNQSQFDLY